MIDDESRSNEVSSRLYFPPEVSTRDRNGVSSNSGGTELYNLQKKRRKGNEGTVCR